MVKIILYRYYFFRILVRLGSINLYDGKTIVILQQNRITNRLDWCLIIVTWLVLSMLNALPTFWIKHHTNTIGPIVRSTVISIIIAEKTRIDLEMMTDFLKSAWTIYFLPSPTGIHGKFLVGFLWLTLPQRESSMFTPVLNHAHLSFIIFICEASK